MASLIPAELDTSVPAGERAVAEALRDHLPDHWTIIHGQRLATAPRGRTHLRESEMDLIVIAPGHGVACLEVKGGREVGRDEGGWYSVDERGVRHTIKDPGRQAQESSHQLHHYLKELPDAVLPGGPPPFAWGVAFPGVTLGGRVDASLPRELVLDQGDLLKPRPLIDRLFAQFPSDRRFEPAHAAAVVDAIAPRYQLVSTLAASVETSEAAIVRLTDQQLEAVDGLADARRVAVQGPAGTGKTMIAVERARRLARDGARVLLVCFNKLLASRLQPAARGFRVVHFHGLCHELCEEAGVLAESVPEEPEAQQRFYREEAPSRMIDALGRLLARRCDAVIVDEGQDFSPRMWDALVALLADPGRGHLWLFYDPEQNIYDGELPSHLNLTPFRLTVNCRNTQPIARFAYAAVGAEPRLRPSAPASPEVTTVTYATEAELLAGVQRALESLTGPGGLPPDRIVVLSPRGVKKSAVWAHRRFGRFTLQRFEEGAHSAASTIRFSTLQGFKGLEADAVVLCEVSPTTAPRAVYVAASRAKHVLWCVAEN